MRKSYTLRLPHDRRLELGARTLVVGVINVTPDSFSDGGVNFDPSRAIDRAVQLESEGADIIEVGGESTRPGSARVTLEDELERVIPVLKGLAGRLKVPVSVDTYKREVAEAALEFGASLINDISALRFDPCLADAAARAGSALILMHMRGDPTTMQQIQPSRDIFAEIESDLATAVALAQSRGVERDRIIIDPGIGFGKTLEQNLAIINQVDRFSRLDLPLMIGSSRKSFIGRLTSRPADERIFGTAASVTLAIARGAHVVRVHDVREMVEVARIADAVVSAQ